MCWSSWKTWKLVILSGIEGTTTNSNKNLLNLVHSIGESALAEVANASTIAFFFHGMDVILKA